MGSSMLSGLTIVPISGRVSIHRFSIHRYCEAGTIGTRELMMRQRDWVMLVEASLGVLSSPNFGFSKQGYEVRGISITPGSRDFETRESSGRRERNQPKRMSRRPSERSLDGESSRGKSFAKHCENKGQKRKQADVLRRRPVGIT